MTFEEIDIQKTVLINEIVVLEVMTLWKTHAKEFICDTVRSWKNKDPEKLKIFNQKLSPNKTIEAYWEVLTENTCFEISRW